MTKALLTGWIVVHAAFPAVLDNYPDRVDQSATGYVVAVSDCNALGAHLVLVRPGQPDVLLSVADCADPDHVAERAAAGLIADVDEAVWRGPWVPQRAELWTPAARAQYLKRMERLE